MSRWWENSRKEQASAQVSAAYAQAPVEIWSLASGNRQSVVALADVRSKQPAPVYVDWFTWQPFV